MTAFSPTTFDQAFVKAVNYLINAGQVSSQTALAEEMNMLPQHLWAVLNGSRGVSKTKKDFSKYILERNYHVRPGFLDSMSGAILADPDEIDEHAHPQYRQLEDKYNELVEENKALRRELKDVRDLCETQRLFIQSIITGNEKTAKKAAK